MSTHFENILTLTVKAEGDAQKHGLDSDSMILTQDTAVNVEYEAQHSR